MGVGVTFTTKERGPAVGVVDGGHVILKCSNCLKPLVDVFITQPNKKIPGTDEPFIWRLRATCCYGCKKPNQSPETSFIETIKGMFHPGGYGVDDPNNPDESEIKTKIVNIVEEKDHEGNPVVTFITVRA